MPSCSSPAPSCPSPTPSYPSPTPLLPLPPAQSWAMTSRLIQRHTRNHVNRGFPASRLAGIQAGRRQSLYQTTSFCHSVSSVTSNSRPLAGSGYVASEVTAIFTFLDHDHRGVGEGCVWGGVGGGGGGSRQTLHSGLVIPTLSMRFRPSDKGQSTVYELPPAIIL